MGRSSGIRIVLSAIFFLLIPASVAAVPPSAGTITPLTGSSNPNETVVFTTTYRDPDGWRNIWYVNLLVNTSTNGANCFYAYYDQNTNRLYLRNDANNSWLGGYAPGSANVIENSYAILDCAGTRVFGAGRYLIVGWRIIFKSSFAGSKATYLYVRDDSRTSSRWVQRGKWTIINQRPSAGTITPQSGASTPDTQVSFLTTYSDPDGWLNIQYVYLLVNTSTAGTNCFYGYYNQNTNKLYLRDDAGTGWLGGYIPGSANIIENSYARINCSGTSVSGADTLLSVNWDVSFKPAFTGAKNTYLYVRDDANTNSGWQRLGTWIIDGTPPAGTISINNGNPFTNLNQITLTLSAVDPETGITQMQFSNDNVIWTEPESYTNTKDWLLPAGDGTKIVYAMFQNGAGIWTDVISDEIILDTTPPQIQITSPVDNTLTNQPDIDVSGTFTESYISTIAVNGIQAVINEDVFTAQEVPLTNEGNNQISVTAADLAGNQGSIQVNIIRDTTPPEIEITIPENGYTTNRDSIRIWGRTNEEAMVEIGGVNAVAGRNQFAFEELPLNTGENNIDIEAVDLAGNRGSHRLVVNLVNEPQPEMLIDNFGDAAGTTNNIGFLTGDNQTCTEDMDIDGAHRLSWDNPSAYWYTNLWDAVGSPTGVDISPYERLVFRVRGASGGENFSIELEDVPHGPDFDKRVEVDDYINITTDWQEVTIPIVDFSVEGIWKTHARSIVFNFNKTVSGTIYIDDIRLESCVIRSFTDEINGSHRFQWNSIDDYWDIDLGFNADGFRYIYLRIRGETSGEDLSIELQDNNAADSVNLAGYINLTRMWDYVYIPLADFSIDKANLERLTLRFNRQDSGIVYIDKVGITNTNGSALQKPQGTGPVRIINRQITINGMPFQIRGAGYQPTPIGSDSRINALFHDSNIYNRDLPLLREMGCNSIRLWKRLNNTGFLDACYNNGVDPIYVILGFNISPTSDLSSNSVRNLIKEEFRSFVMTYTSHPAVLLWALGNEMNMLYRGSIRDWYSLANELAEIAYEAEGEGYHPVAVTNMDLLYICDGDRFTLDDNLNYIDIWGINAYRGLSFRGFFESYQQLTSKPLWISEYGADSWHTNNPAMPSNGYEDPVTQARYYFNNWDEIRLANQCLGATLMEYCDELWKATGGDWAVQDHRGFRSRYDQPDNYSNEEFWGLFKVMDNGADPDILIPKMAYEVMKMAFHNEGYPDLGMAWEFNTNGDTEGWTAVQSLDNFHVGGGVLLSDISGNNPHMESPAGLSINALVYNTFVIRYRTTLGQRARLVWGPDNVQEFSIFGDNRFHTYSVYLGDNPGWNGTITQIGLYPTTSPSDGIEIDYIRLEHRDIPLDITPPEDVTGLTVRPGDTIVDLSWTASLNSAGDLADQVLYIDNDIGRSLGPIATNTRVTGLDNGVSYTFKITTKDAVPNESNGITMTAAPIDTTAPEDITNLTASPGNGFIDLSWTASIDSGGDLADQILYIDDGAGIRLGSGVTNYRAGSLINGIIYRFRITVVDEVLNESAGVVIQAQAGDPDAVIIIDSPQNESYISDTQVDVSGSYDGEGVDITVNDIPAVINGNNFIANNIPIIEGRNIITATLRTGDEVLGSYSVGIIRDTIPPLVEITDPRDGEEVAGRP